MIRKLVSAALIGAFALTSSLAFAQDQPSTPAPAAQSPQMPATPSMDQKGSDDMSKPAGASSKAPMSKKSSMKHHMSKHHMTSKHHMSKHHMMKGHISKKSMTKK